MSSRATTVPLLVLLGQGAKPYLRDFPDSLLHLEPSLREGQVEAHLHHVPQGGLTLLGLHGKGKKSSSPGSRMCLCGGLHGKGKRLHPRLPHVPVLLSGSNRLQNSCREGWTRLIIRKKPGNLAFPSLLCGEKENCSRSRSSERANHDWPWSVKRAAEAGQGRTGTRTRTGTVKVKWQSQRR